AMGLHRYGVICDGNVKRVLTRWAAIDGDITKSATTKELWALAERLTPRENSGLFAQAMMDMGATLCTRSKPACLLCPLQDDCLAPAQGRETDYPVKAKKQPKPSKFSNAFLSKDADGNILWLQRPDTGIWGGLRRLPLQFVKKTAGKMNTKTAAEKTTQIDDTLLKVASNEKVYETEFATAEQIINEWLIKNNLAAAPISKTLLEDAPIKHSLTHFHWYLTPQSVTLNNEQTAEITQALQAAEINMNWLNADDAQATLGLPRAMVKILE